MTASVPVIAGAIDDSRRLDKFVKKQWIKTYQVHEMILIFDRDKHRI